MAITNGSDVADTWKRSTIVSRLISLGFYDGTTSGLIEMEAGRVFRYDVVSWDDQQDRRVYCLARMPASAFDELIELLSPFETPHWPEWYPRWEFSPDIDRSAARILDQAEPYSVAGVGSEVKAIDDALTLEGQAYDNAQEFRQTAQLQPFNGWLSLIEGK